MHEQAKNYNLEMTELQEPANKILIHITERSSTFSNVIVHMPCLDRAFSAGIQNFSFSFCLV